MQIWKNIRQVKQTRKDYIERDIEKIHLDDKRLTVLLTWDRREYAPDEMLEFAL